MLTDKEFKIPIHFEDLELEKDDRCYITEIKCLESSTSTKINDLLDGKICLLVKDFIFINHKFRYYRKNFIP